MLTSAPPGPVDVARQEYFEERTACDDDIIFLLISFSFNQLRFRVNYIKICMFREFLFDSAKKSLQTPITLRGFLQLSPSRRIIRNKRRSEAGDLLNKRSRCRSNKEYFVYLLVARLPFRLFQRFQRSRFRIPLRHTSCSFVDRSSCILSEISLELFCSDFVSTC